MPRFTTVTEALEDTAVEVGLLANRLHGARAALGRVESAGFAADHPPVAGALGGFVEAWSAAVVAMGEGVRGLGANVDASAAAYERTDASLFAPW